jgi:hypothetical protein
MIGVNLLEAEQVLRSYNALSSFFQKDTPAEHKVEQGHFSIFIFSL